MNLQELRKIINEYKDKIIINHPQCKNNKLLLKQYNNLLRSTSEMVYLVKNYNNLENLHIFCECGNKNIFYNINEGYSKFCSKICMKNNIYLVVQKAKQTWIKKYGVDNPNKCKEVREKIEQTNLKRYGVKHNWSSKDPKLNGSQTKLEKYGDIWHFEKCKQTWIKNYGVDNPWKDKNIIKQIKYNMRNDIDENGLNGLQRAAIKGVQTAKNNIDENGLNSYQREHNNKLNNTDEKGLNSYQRSIIRQLQTKKKNNSFTKSKDEENIYNLLLQKFGKDDIVRQYTSELYPFNCDFYIKFLDLYIEYHGTWTHSPVKNKHKKPFKHSVEDMKIIEELRNKNSDYYDTAIYIWTDLDVRKLNTFKKNKLNYKIFYSMEQFLNWYKNFI